MAEICSRRWGALSPGKSTGDEDFAAAAARVAPPPSLPAVDLSDIRGPVPVADRTPVQVCELMAAAYLGESGRANAGALFRIYKKDDIWQPVMLANAQQVIMGRRDPVALVRYICRKHKTKYGRLPFPAQVFSAKAMSRWIPEYARNWSEVRARPKYLATVERREERKEMMRDAEGSLSIRRSLLGGAGPENSR